MTTDDENNAHRFIRICSVCQNQAELLCQRCQEPYCSYKCQTFDWPNHKSLCGSMPSLVTAANFDVQRPQSPCLDDILLPPSLIDSLRADFKTEYLMQKFQQNNYSSSLKTELKSKASPTCASFVIRNPLSLVQTIYGFSDDQSEALKYAPTMVSTINGTDSQQPKMFNGETKQIDTTSKMGHFISNSPKIRPMTIPKPAEMEIAPKSLKVEVPQKPFGIEVSTKQVFSSASSTLTEARTKTFPIEETGFVCVIVQFTPMKCSQTVWVIVEENEAINIGLLPSAWNAKPSKPDSGADSFLLSEIFAYIKSLTKGIRKGCRKIWFAGKRKPATSNSLVMIDSNNESNVPSDALKRVNPTIKKLPAFGFQIKFQTPREVEIGDVLKIQVKSTCDGNIMNVLVEGEVAFATRDDLETVPLPVGTKTNLYCLDYSNIEKGYVAACVYDTKEIDRIEKIGVKISEYCARSMDSYNPQLNELCLALCEDGEWYRAVTGKLIDSNTFGMVLVDYGNMTIVNSLNIRKITEKFMHPCLMNNCYFKGAPEKPTDDDIKKMVLYFSENQVFTIESATKDNAGYMINVAELQW